MVERGRRQTAYAGDARDGVLLLQGSRGEQGPQRRQQGDRRQAAAGRPRRSLARRRNRFRQRRDAVLAGRQDHWSAPPAAWSRAAKRRSKRPKCGPSPAGAAPIGNSRRSSRPADRHNVTRKALRFVPRRLFLCCRRCRCHFAHRNNASAADGVDATTNQKTTGRNQMNSFARIISPACFALAAISALASAPAQAQSADTSFFLTSNGIGNGGNLGGLAGADNHCQTLAQAAGAGGKTWRAYLSTQAADGQPAVNARDRIGKGPWKNAKGVVVAKDVADLQRRQQPHQADRAQRKGRGHQRPRRHAEPPRRADGIAGRTAPRSRPATTAPARTGRAARKAPRWSAIPTAWACATTTPRSPGTPRIPRAARTAAARRPT